MKRGSFIAAAGGGIATLAGAPVVAAPPLGLRKGRKALVLVGGVNRGAYQAGAICALADKLGLKDGQPLDYDMVCGTSIGALNSYFIATAQYTQLKDLWVNVIAGENVFRLKHPYEKIPNNDSGIITRLAAALSLGNGMAKDVKGVLDSAPVEAMLDRFFDPSKPVHIPSYIATTNLSRQTGQVFNRRATTPNGLEKQAIDDRLLADFPIKAVVASDAIIHKVYFATAALPLAFDPVEIERQDGSGNIDQYVDGGVTANAPINQAQLCVENLHVLLVDPKTPEPDIHYKNAVEIALGVFATMQSRILMYQMIAAYAAGQATLPFDASIMRPEKPLPGKLGDFNDAAANGAMFEIGYADGQRGWQEFVFPQQGLLAPFDRLPSEPGSGR